jgi:hypothetical protein
MLRRNTVTVILVALCILVLAAMACAPLAGQQPTIDPNKQYAAFLVSNVTGSAKILEKMKQQSIADGFEIGPVAYYGPGTKDFEPIIKPLVSNPQVTLLWVGMAGIMEARDIQNGITAAGYKSGIRYMQVTAQAAQ